MHRRLMLGFALLAGVAAGTVEAQTPPIRVRGTVASFADGVLNVNSRDGQKLEIMLPDAVAVGTLKKVELSAITPGSFIGTATRVAADGTQTAIEVFVFPEAMRGTGEGHHPWDLEPGSMMTNGTVKGEVTGTAGHELSIAYKDGDTKVIVPPGIPIVTPAPASRADLKPGAPVFVVVKKDEAGKMTAAAVRVGTNGVAPPM